MKKVENARPLKGRWVRVWFTDGAVMDIDLSEVFARGGVFTPIRDDRSVFEQVRVNPQSRTVEWPGEVDLDPDVLYGQFEPASGVRSSVESSKSPKPHAPDERGTVELDRRAGRRAGG